MPQKQNPGGRRSMPSKPAAGQIAEEGEGQKWGQIRLNWMLKLQGRYNLLGQLQDSSR